MNEPLVTVVTATYNLIDNNRKETFLQTVESVKSQTYKNIEHLIIDGGSTDGTIDLIKSTGLKYISEPDNGIYDAFNKGTLLANGKYICFLNSDDFFCNSDAVKLSVEALEKNDADFSYGVANIVDEDNNLIHLQKPCIHKMYTKMPFCHQTMFTKTNLIKEEGMFDTNFKIAADYDLTFKLLSKKYTSIFINEILTTFRASGLSCTDEETTKKERIMVYKKHYEKYLKLTEFDYNNIEKYSFLPISLLFKFKESNIKSYLYYLPRKICRIRLSKNPDKRCFMLLGKYFIRPKKELEKPLVTIVTATYNLIEGNRKETFLQAVESVKNQTYENIEHLVIDGGSTDGTIDLIKSTGLKYISEPDNGIYDAFNKGIMLAKGKYINFLNSDDFFNNNKAVELSVQKLEETQADFSFASANVVGENDRKLFTFKPQIYSTFSKMPFCHQTMFTRKDVMIKEGLFNLKYKSASDLEFIIRLLINKYKFVKVNKNIATFRAVGFSIEANSISFKEQVEIHRALYSPHISNRTFDFEKIFLCDNVPLELLLNLQIKNPLFYIENINQKLKLLKRKIFHLRISLDDRKRSLRIFGIYII